MRVWLFLLLFGIGNFTVLGQSARECENAILVCGDVSFGLEPDGVGADEFDLPGNERPPCYSFNNNTIWVQFLIEEAGDLTFDLIPDSDQADYDFAIFGPNVDCENLGAAIRCSSTNPQAAGVSVLTGLNFEETDHFEGPGEDGNGYLQFIPVEAGEVYYMVIDRPHGSGGFSLDMTGSAVLPDQPFANSASDMSQCENDEIVDESMPFDLDSQIAGIIQNQQNVSVSFHASLNDANIGANPLVSPYNNTTNPQTIHYRIENVNSGCFDIDSFELRIESNFSVSLPEDLFVCNDESSSVLLSTDQGYSFYEWSTGESGPNTYQISITQGGDYSVIVTDQEGCKAGASTFVNSSEAAVITDVIIEEFRDRDNSVTVVVEGNGDYHYQLDPFTPYQDEPVFLNVRRGYHDVIVRDKNGCGLTTQRILILDYPRFFTPNADGINDKWNIEGFREFPGSKIIIFDRYGNIIKGIPHNSSGWDGTDQNGVPVASNDYWFTITMEDGREIRGHFTLKR